MGERERNRCVDRIEALTRAGLDADQARREAIAELRRAIGFERWCWPLTDPDTGLAMSGIGEFDFASSLLRLVALEEQGDVTSKPQLILGARASVALSAATGGELARSRRWRECLHPYGIGDELMTACRDRHGCWGSVELMRDAGDRRFHEEEVALLERLAPLLARLLRHSLVRSWESDGVDAHLPEGILLLDGELTAVGWTAPLHQWLGDLAVSGHMLPPAIHEIGARVLTPANTAHGLAARVRVRTGTGRWSVIEGARLEGDSSRVAITIRAATADEVFDMICKASELTKRERQLVGLVREGLATRHLADTLAISPYTVQDHLKAIFAKTGVRSRRELMSRLVGSRPDAHSKGAG